MHRSNVWLARLRGLLPFGLCGVLLATVASTAAPAATRVGVDDPRDPAPVRPLASALVFDRFEHIKPRSMELKFADASVQVEVAEHQPCPTRGILMDDEGEGPSPEAGQFCTVATLVAQAPNHPEFRQVIASLLTGDNGALATLHLALYQLEAGDGPPQLLLSGYTGGAHCCTVSALVGADRTGTWHVSALPPQDGDGVSGAVDIKHDNGRQLIFLDERFNYRFESYVWSVKPIVIYEYAQGQLRNVTTQPAYRPFLRAYFRHDFAPNNMSGFDHGAVNGFLAAYVANSANLGQLQAGWQFMLRHYNRKTDNTGVVWCALDRSVWSPAGQEDCPAPYVRTVPYPQQLALFLLQTGYITHAQCVAFGYDPEKIRQTQEQVIARTTARWKAAHP
ncbi:MAG: thylakoid lumen protein [Acetobacter fabarum]|uniref:thylakoid lumen protein n=1 Tax=Acetobacter fabarum TaxID=483199 RepID=UPI0039EB8D71